VTEQKKVRILWVPKWYTFYFPTYNSSLMNMKFAAVEYIYFGCMGSIG